jgi:hypothetical protein
MSEALFFCGVASVWEALLESSWRVFAFNSTCMVKPQTANPAPGEPAQAND